MTDPNPNVSGNGIRKLQDAGIDVVSDVMAAEAAALNPGFIKRMLTGKPYVRAKLGISIDGKIALQNGDTTYDKAFYENKVHTMKFFFKYEFVPCMGTVTNRSQSIKRSREQTGCIPI